MVFEVYNGSISGLKEATVDTYEYVTINPSADRILIIASGSGIRRVIFGDFETVLDDYPDAARTSTDILEDAGWQISEYLQGKREQIDIPIDLPAIPPYYEEILHSLQRIPYGETRTYAQVAHETGHDKASRAVGNACRTNPVPIIIPCHRVVPSNGTPGNYLGGVEMKTALLRLEKEHENRSVFH